MKGTNPLTAENIISGLALYFSPVDYLSKKKRAMRRGMMKPCGLKVRRYVDRFIDLNEYLDLFPGGKFQKNWHDGSELNYDK